MTSLHTAYARQHSDVTFPGNFSNKMGVFCWTRQRVWYKLIVWDRELQLMLDKTYLDSDPTFVAVLDLTHQPVPDPYNIIYLTIPIILTLVFTPCIRANVRCGVYSYRCDIRALTHGDLGDAFLSCFMLAYYRTFTNSINYMYYMQSSLFICLITKPPNTKKTTSNCTMHGYLTNNTFKVHGKRRTCHTKTRFIDLKENESWQEWLWPGAEATGGMRVLRLSGATCQFPLT